MQLPEHTEEARSLVQGLPSEDVDVPAGVRQLYERCVSGEDAGALEQLQQMVEEGRGGAAACLALAKAYLLRMARECAACAAAKFPVARLFPYIARAAEAAVTGVVRHHSARCLVRHCRFA
jgi:hypothetical protein